MSGSMIFTIVFLLVGGVLTIMSWISLLRWQLLGIRSKSSGVPILGGVFAAIGLYIMPVQGVRQWCWIPLLVDVSCIPLIAYMIFVSMTRPKNKSA